MEGWILKQVQKHFLKKIIYLGGHKFEYYCKILLKWWLPSWWLSNTWTNISGGFIIIYIKMKIKQSTRPKNSWACLALVVTVVYFWKSTVSKVLIFSQSVSQISAWNAPFILCVKYFFCLWFVFCGNHFNNLYFKKKPTVIIILSICTIYQRKQIYFFLT